MFNLTWRSARLGFLAIGVMLAPAAVPRVGAEEPAGKWIFACTAQNDLYRVVCRGGTRAPRHDRASEAIGAAAPGAGVLILADGYPQQTTEVAATDYALAAEKGLRLYVEFPGRLPGMQVGPPERTRWERGVVTSDFFGERLPAMRIVMIHDCRFVSLEAESPHLVIARVAGVDTAVFGLQDTKTRPILFEHPRGNLLAATTKLSHFVTARYMPADAWRAIWRSILLHLQPGAKPPELSWTPTVGPTYSREEPLPADAERRALARSAGWYSRARLLRHPAWPKEVLNRSLTYNTVRDMPSPDWPQGDGSLGVLEGFSSTIRHDGSQPMRYAVRNDCMGEIAMALAFDGAIHANRQNALTAGRILDYTLSDSPLAQGPRADPEKSSYGLVGWALDHPDSYWGDDNARAMLGVLASAALLDESRWDPALVRCLLGNLRTTGVYGYREACVTEGPLNARGWQAYWSGRRTHYSPHFQAWLWACYLWAYEKTGFEPFLQRSKTGIRRLMLAYPDHWAWCLRSSQIERARALLPLAWLVRVEDTPEHRGWLRRVAGDLLALQDECGAIREAVGDGGFGTRSNAEYGTSETSLIQANGDPVADSLYTCNFALIGLHEAAAATGDPFYREAEDKLAEFFCRAQIRSERHPELDGAWYRAFDFKRWEYWASAADWEWGPWCTESGWTQPWIAATLALRQMKTSLWELTADKKLDAPFDRYRRQMLPDDVLRVKPFETVRHEAIGRPVALAKPADPRYPAAGPMSLTDGTLAEAEYRSGDWLGFHGVDVEATVDLGKPMPIRQLGVRCLQQTAVGIFLPKHLELAVSDDGKTFRHVATAGHEVVLETPGPLVRWLRAEGLEARGRYVRMVGRNVATIPAGHAAAGSKAWLFVDEISLNAGDAEK